MNIRIPLLVACGLIAAASVPLILRWVGPNPIYGFRTPRTLSSPEIWYPANAFAGWALLISAAVSAVGLSLIPAHCPFANLDPAGFASRTTGSRGRRMPPIPAPFQLTSRSTWKIL